MTRVRRCRERSREKSGLPADQPRVLARHLLLWLCVPRATGAGPHPVAQDDHPVVMVAQELALLAQKKGRMPGEAGMRPARGRCGSKKTCLRSALNQATGGPWNPPSM